VHTSQSPPSTVLLEIARLWGERPLRQSARAPCWHRFGRLPSSVSLSHRRRARRAKGRPRGRRRRGRRAAARANQVPQSQRHAPLAEGGRGDRGEIRRARALEPAARRQQRQQGTRLIRQQGTRNSARPYAVVPRGHPRNHRRPPRALSLSSPSWPGSPPSAASHASW